MIRKRFRIDNGSGQQLAASVEQPDGSVRAMALFAHCFTCSKEFLAASRISRALAESGIGVVRFDFTGLGKSDGDFSNTNFSSNIEDIWTVCSYMHAHLQPADILIGHSFGGTAALAAAERVPEAKIIVTINSPSEPAHVRSLFRNHMEQIESEGCAPVTIAGRPFRIRKQFFEDVDQHQVGELLNKLRQAILVFHSPSDPLVGPEHGLRIFDKANHPKSFISLGDADHLLSRKEDTAFVASVISAWVTRFIEPLE